MTAGQPCARHRSRSRRPLSSAQRRSSRVGLPARPPSGPVRRRGVDIPPRLPDVGALHRTVRYGIARTPSQIVRARPAQAARTTSGGYDPEPTSPFVHHRGPRPVRPRMPQLFRIPAPCGGWSMSRVRRQGRRPGRRCMTRSVAHPTGSTGVRLIVSIIGSPLTGHPSDAPDAIARHQAWTGASPSPPRSAMTPARHGRRAIRPSGSVAARVRCTHNERPSEPRRLPTAAA